METEARRAAELQLYDAHHQAKLERFSALRAAKRVEPERPLHKPGDGRRVGASGAGLRHPGDRESWRCGGGVTMHDHRQGAEAQPVY
jgi:hypothetical protein